MQCVVEGQRGSHETQRESGALRNYRWCVKRWHTAEKKTWSSAIITQLKHYIFSCISSFKTYVYIRAYRYRYTYCIMP